MDQVVTPAPAVPEGFRLLRDVGGFISPVLTPKLAESMGWTAAIGIACAICGFGGFIWLWINTTASKPTVPAS